MTKARFVVIIVLLVYLLAAQNGTAKDLYDVNSGSLSFDSRVNVVLAEPDGGVLVGGDFSEFQKKRVPSLVRLKPDGTLDTAFGTLKTNWQGTVNDVARLKDGKILVVGKNLTAGTAPPAGVLRLSSTGAPDQGFALKTAQFSEFSRVFVLKNGEIVLMLGNRKLSRLTEDGMLQPLNSMLTARVTGAAATPDGKLLVALEENNGWKLERWTADGERDKTFTSSIDIEPPPLRGSFGIELSKSDNRIVISGFDPNANAGMPGGLQKGDVLIEIAEAGKKPVKIEQMEAAGVQALLEGKPGVPVTFTVERKSQGSGSSRLSLTFRRQAVKAEHQPRKDSGYEESMTIFAFQDSGSVVVAPGQYKEGQQKIVRLLPDGKKDNRFSRVPRDLPPDELEKLFNDTVEVYEGDATEPEIMLFTESRRPSYEDQAPSVPVAMAPDSGGKTIIGLSEGHVLRLESDGSLDEKFHLRYEGPISAIVPAKEGRFWVLHDAPSHEGGMNLSLIGKDGKIER